MPTRSELEHDDPGVPPWRDAPRTEEYDALADLFLGGPARDEGAHRAAPAAPQIAAPTSRLRVDAFDRLAAPPMASDAPADVAPPLAPAHHLPEVEGLILGHLPVAAGAWASQYAAWRAATLGGPVALLRISAGLASIDLIGAGRDSAPPACSDPCAAIDRALGRARCVIVRVDATDEPGLVAHRAVTRLSLLTSADEPATLAAYRTLKSILGATRDDAPRRETRVIFLGSDGAAARRAGAKIRSACSTFLDREVEWAIGPERIAPAPAAPLHRGSSGGAERLLDDLAGAMDRARLAPPVATPTPLDAFAVASLAPAHDSAGAPPPNPERTARAPLASMLPGLRPLPLRCPLAAGVEFAIGEGGTLHALHDAGPRAAEALLAAQAWARENWATISLAAAHAGPALAERAHVRLHALGERFDDLRALLGTPVHAHLVAPASPSARALPLSPDAEPLA